MDEELKLAWTTCVNGGPHYAVIVTHDGGIAWACCACEKSEFPAAAIARMVYTGARMRARYWSVMLPVLDDLGEVH